MGCVWNGILAYYLLCTATLKNKSYLLATMVPWRTFNIHGTFIHWKVLWGWIVLRRTIEEPYINGSTMVLLWKSLFGSFILRALLLFINCRHYSTIPFLNISMLHCCHMTLSQVSKCVVYGTFWQMYCMQCTHTAGIVQQYLAPQQNKSVVI